MMDLAMMGCGTAPSRTALNLSGCSLLRPTGWWIESSSRSVSPPRQAERQEATRSKQRGQTG